MNIAVLGVGNILLSDEGAGVRAVESLREKYDFPESVELIDGGTMGLDLLPFIEGKDKLLIIDAVTIDKPPGTLIKIEGNDIPKFLSLKLSVHQIGLPDMLSAANLMGILPKDMCLIGIQPKSLETGTELTDELFRCLDAVVEKALDTLRAWGVSVREKEKQAEIETG